MPQTSTPLSQSDVATRLRAAGCVFAEDEAALLNAAALARPGAVVVDLCCGSGAVALAAGIEDVEPYAVDIDLAAVACARCNLAAVGGRVYEGDLDDPLPVRLRGRVDMLVANAPYVPTEAVGSLPAEARLHEPRVALDGGADGPDILRRVIAGAPAWLAPGGHLLLEASERQSPHLARDIARCGLIRQVTHSAGLSATVVVGSATNDWAHGPTHAPLDRAVCSNGASTPSGS